MEAYAIHTGVSGEFMAQVHTGHTYDSEGNIVQEGKVLRETEWGRNKITLGGFQALLSTTYLNLTLVVGTGNNAPLESDTNLQVYKGYATSTVYSENLYTTPDVNGYFRIEYIYRGTFNPGSLGASPVNIAEAGMAMAGAGSVNSGTGLLSRGLLTDGLGSPTTVSLDAATEYLDVFWKFTRYIPALVTGSANLDILGTPTVHTYSIRPMVLSPDTIDVGVYAKYFWWPLASSNGMNTFLPTATGGPYTTKLLYPGVFDGDISTDSLGGAPAGTFATYSNSNYTLNAYVPNSKERTFSLQIVPIDSNISGSLKSFTLRWGNSGWMMQMNPAIVKYAVPSRTLRLDFKYTMANYP
jgi:hypothetical protein